MQSRLLDSCPSSQNIIDLFQGEWSSRMPSRSGLRSEPGHADLFNDPRIYWAWSELGPFAGMDILELGPLEGAHSYMLEHLGAASVTAIEANTNAFLRCLCVKEAFGLSRVHFKLGSFFPYLESCGTADLILASGVLYHMTEPLRLLDLLTRRANRIFIWTHYYAPDVLAGREDGSLFAPPEPIGNSSYRGSRRLYPEAALSWQGFSGGGAAHAIWLERESLLAFLRERGFVVSVNFDHPDHPNGPAMALCALR